MVTLDAYQILHISLQCITKELTKNQTKDYDKMVALPQGINGLVTRRGEAFALEEKIASVVDRFRLYQSI